MVRKPVLNSFVVADSSKCIGCKLCEIACSVAHSERKTMTAGTLDAPLVARLYLVRTAGVTMPIQCRHCEDAPCANVCQVSAISRRDGRIVINEKQCVGCKICMMACPFGAIELAPVYKYGEAVVQNFLEETADGLYGKKLFTASKCDLCVEREEGPACVEACPEEALRVVAPGREKKMRNVAAAEGLLKVRAYPNQEWR